MQTGLLQHGSDWNGPKYKISWKARREMELDKSSTNKNNPRMVELSKFPSSSTLPAPLPSGLKNKEIVEIVLAAQKDLATKRSYTKRLRTVFKLMLVVYGLAVAVTQNQCFIFLLTFGLTFCVNRQC